MKAEGRKGGRAAGTAALCLLLLSAVPPFRLSAQTITLAGRVLHVRGTDTIPAARLMVVAHGVGSAKQGPLDSMPSDASGRFHFRVRASSDTGMVYVVSASWGGIGYFSQPFASGSLAGSDSIALLVYDTASAGEPLMIGMRHVVITKAAQDGSRHVLDIVQVRNSGQTTRVAADSLTPVWRMRLPPSVVGPAVGDGDVSPSSVSFRDGSVLVAAPFPPGEKQIAVTYDIPAGRSRFDVPVDQATALIEVLAEDSTTAPAAVLERSDPMPVEDRVFQRFVGTDLKAGATPAVSLTGSGDPVARFIWLPIVAAVLLLAGGGFYAARVARR